AVRPVPGRGPDPEGDEAEDDGVPEGVRLHLARLPVGRLLLLGVGLALAPRLRLRGGRGRGRFVVRGRAGVEAVERVVRGGGGRCVAAGRERVVRGGRGRLVEREWVGGRFGDDLGRQLLLVLGRRGRGRLRLRGGGRGRLLRGRGRRWRRGGGFLGFAAE